MAIAMCLNCRVGPLETHGFHWICIRQVSKRVLVVERLRRLSAEHCCLVSAYVLGLELACKVSATTDWMHYDSSNRNKCVDS